MPTTKSQKGNIKLKEQLDVRTTNNLSLESIFFLLPLHLGLWMQASTAATWQDYGAFLLSTMCWQKAEEYFQLEIASVVIPKVWSCPCSCHNKLVMYCNIWWPHTCNISWPQYDHFPLKWTQYFFLFWTSSKFIHFILKAKNQIISTKNCVGWFVQSLKSNTGENSSHLNYFYTCVTDSLDKRGHLI